MIRRPPRSTQSRSSAASDVYKRQVQGFANYLTKEEPLIRVTTAERTVEGYFAVFGNSSNYGGGFGITPLADMRDGLLDVCVLKDKSFLSTIWYWSAALINAHIKHPKVEYFRTEAAEIVTVEEGKEVLVQTDGEMAGKLPLTCRVVPRSLRVATAVRARPRAAHEE